MSVANHIFDFIIAPIREADERDGGDFLKRYFEGAQNVWETTDQKIKDIPKLWSVDDCPDEYLQYLKNIVGWTSQLEHITDELDFDELRRLISVSGTLWKERGPEDTLIDVLFFALGARSRYWNWFDFRWVLPYVGPSGTVSWLGYYLFNVNPAVGTARREGTLVRITCLPTGQYVEQGTEWSFDVNHIRVIGLMGQGAPSTDPNDFQIRLVNPLGTELGEEHEGRDPWMVDLPDPDISGAEYESNLRIVDDGTLNRTLVVNLVKLMRATGEKWEITYLGFLDRFIIDGDDTQWDAVSADFLSVEGGVLKLGDVTETDETKCIVPSAVWSQAMYTVRMRGGADTLDSRMAVFFHLVDDANLYGLFISLDGTTLGPQLVLASVKSGGESILATVDMTFSPLYSNVYYTYRITIVDEGADKRIKIFVDGNEYIDVLDSSPIAQGSIGLASDYTVLECDEVEVISLPAESDYVDINS